jgi:hypothetical protein
MTPDGLDYVWQTLWMKSIATADGCITLTLDELTLSQMRDVLQTEELDIPPGVEITIKSRVITVSGPRGTLTKNVRHVDMDIQVIKGKTTKVTLAVWQAGRKHVACLRTIRSMINNMVIGVTKVSLLNKIIHSASRHVGLPIQNACCLCPFPYQLHHSGERPCRRNPQLFG